MTPTHYQSESASQGTYQFLRRIRSRPRINNAVRNALTITRSTAEAGLKRWPVHGISEISCDGATIRMMGRGDDHVLTAVAHGREFESLELKAWSGLMPESGSVIDVGSNTGLYSLMASQINPELRVIAVEPHPVNAARLRANVTINATANVSVEEVAAGSSSGRAELWIPADGSVSLVPSLTRSFSSAHFGLEYVPHEVDVVMVDDLVSTHELTDVRLLKIDVESHELPAIQGALGTLRSHRPIVLCEVTDPEIFSLVHADDEVDLAGTDPRAIEEILAEIDYMIFGVGQHGLVRLPNLLGSVEPVTNFVFAPSAPTPRLIRWDSLEVLRTSREDTP